MISLFSICSGLRADLDKTQVVWIGARQGCGLELKTNTDIEWNHSGSIKLFGIQYSLAKDDRYIYNYYSKLEKIKKLLNDWSLRNISLLGKITVIKTLALPILVQCFTVLPDPPDHIIKSLQNIFYIFIWNGKTDKIKRSTLICDYSNGGLKMPHIQSYIHALKVSWIKKMLDPLNQGPWKVLISYHLDASGGEKLWYLSPSGLKQLSKRFNSFWRDVILHYASIVIIHPQSQRKL